MAGTLAIVFPPTEGNRREVVKAGPMMTLQAVLAEACSRGKRPLDPAGYLLMNGKKEVDLTLTVRFSGLPGGTKLDAVPRPPGSAPTTTAPVPVRPAAPPAEQAASASAEAAAPAPDAALPETVDAGPSSAGMKDAEMVDAPDASELKAEALVGRRMRIFSRSGLESLPAVDAFPPEEDDFFEFTPDDLRLVMASAHRQQPQMLTKEMREREELEKAKSFARTVVRVQLPDGHIIESAFAPLDSVRDLHNAVLSACEPGAPLYLFTAPPKERLDPLDRTLYKAGLVPAARVFAGIDSEKAEGWEGRTLLLESVLSLVDAELPKMRAAREAVLAQQQAQKAAAAAAAAAAEAAAEAAAAGASGSGGSAQQDGGSAAAAAGVVGGGGAAAGGDSAMDGNGEEVLRKKLATGGKPKWMKL